MAGPSRSARRKGSPSRVQPVPFGGSIASRVAGKRSAGGGTDLRETKKKARAGDVVDLTEKMPATAGEAESPRDPDQLFGSMALREAMSDAADKALEVRGFSSVLICFLGVFRLTLSCSDVGLSAYPGRNHPL